MRFLFKSLLFGKVLEFSAFAEFVAICRYFFEQTVNELSIRNLATLLEEPTTHHSKTLYHLHVTFSSGLALQFIVLTFSRFTLEAKHYNPSYGVDHAGRLLVLENTKYHKCTMSK